MPYVIENTKYSLGWPYKNKDSLELNNLLSPKLTKKEDGNISPGHPIALHVAAMICILTYFCETETRTSAMVGMFCTAVRIDEKGLT